MRKKVNEARGKGQMSLIPPSNVSEGLQNKLRTQLRHELTGLTQRIMNINPDHLPKYLSDRGLMTSFYNLYQTMQQFKTFLGIEEDD